MWSKDEKLADILAEERARLTEPALSRLTRQELENRLIAAQERVKQLERDAAARDPHG